MHCFYLSTFAKHYKINAHLSTFNSPARRGCFFPLFFHLIWDDFLWNHAVAVVLLASLSCVLSFVTISSRNVVVATGFSSTYHSHEVWRSLSQCCFHRFGLRFQQWLFPMQFRIDIPFNHRRQHR